MLRFLRNLGRVLTLPFVLLLLLWACLAIWFDGPASRPLAGCLAGGFALCTIVLLAVVRPFRRALFAFAFLFLAVLAWWQHIEPSNSRNWQRDVARVASADFEGSKFIVHNLRNFEYRTEFDYTPHWETRTFDLDKLTDVDLFLSFWGPTEIAHTIMSWHFDDGQHLAVSIETRKEEGESYSAVRGFFRQYEVYYVVADERDVVRLRTNYRGETVYLYRLHVPLALARGVLLRYLDEINRLAKKPRWYNAFTHNCTTAIRSHVQEVTPGNRWDWRIMANGHLPELMYERGTLDTSLPLSELVRRSNIVEKAKAAEHDENFATHIREDLP